MGVLAVDLIAKFSHLDCHTAAGHVCARPRGRFCAKPLCPNLGGTDWTRPGDPLLCPVHDEERLDELNNQWNKANGMPYRFGAEAEVLRACACGAKCGGVASRTEGAEDGRMDDFCDDCSWYRHDIEPHPTRPVTDAD